MPLMASGLLKGAKNSTTPLMGIKPDCLGMPNFCLNGVRAIAIGVICSVMRRLVLIYTEGVEKEYNQADKCKVCLIEKSGVP